MSDGKLALARASDLAGELLPPSTAGWQRYLKLAPASGLKFTALKEAGEDWWGRKKSQRTCSVSARPPLQRPPRSLSPRQRLRGGFFCRIDRHRLDARSGTLAGDSSPRPRRQSG